MSWLRSALLPPAALAALLLLSACDKGTDLNVDLPTVTDINAEYRDLGFKVSTVQFDSLETLKSDHFLAGQLRDEVVGLTTATAVLNLQASSQTDSLPTVAHFTGVVLDSVVFAQGFDVVYGNTTAPALFDLKELAAPLDETSSYTSAKAPVLLASSTIANLPGRLDRTKKVKSVATTGGDTIVTTVADPTLRLTLYNRPKNNTVGYGLSSRLFTAMQSATVFGQAQLDATVKGLVLAANPNYEKAIVSFGRSYESRLVFYFHDRGAATAALQNKWHSVSVLYGPSPSGSGPALGRDPRYYTYIESNKTSALLQGLSGRSAPRPSTDPGLNNLAYLQDGLGLGTKIAFDSTALAGLRNVKGLAVNRAELYIPIKPLTNALLPAANGLFALEVDHFGRILRRNSNLTLVERIVQHHGANPIGVNKAKPLPCSTTPTPAPLITACCVTSYLRRAPQQSARWPPAARAGGWCPRIRRSQNLTLNRSLLDVGNAGRTPRLRMYFSKLR